MKRRILHFFVAASLMLCLATAALYVWSFTHSSFYSTEDTDISIFEGSARLRHYYEDPPFIPKNGRDATFEDQVSVTMGARPETVVEAPIWAFIVAFAVLPAWRLSRWRGRPRPGTCKACGYDLRATSDRCPECGTARAAE
jgi:hypothetical protein